MAVTIYHPGDWKYGFTEQGVWGTAEIDSVAMIELHCGPPDIEPGVNVLSRNLSVGTRQPVAAEVINHTKHVLSTLKLTDVEAKHDVLDYLLYGFFQNVTEDVGSPFKKTFTIHKTAQPDFSANAGEFFTVIAFDPITAKSQKFADVIIQGLTFKCQPGAEGFIRVDVDMVARGLPTHASTPSGTWTAASSDLWHYADVDTATFNFGASTDMHLEGAWELAMTRPVTGFSQDGAGSFESLRLGKPAGTFKISMSHGAGTDLLRTAQETNPGTQGDLRIGIGNTTPGTDDGDLDFAWSGKLDASGGVKINNSGDVSLVEIAGMMLADDASSDMITVIMANTQDRQW
jgi:hypothetical protein